VTVDAATRVRELAATEGFPLVAFARATPLPEAGAMAQRAKGDGHLDGLGWMTEAWLDAAVRPETFLPGARSVVLCGLPYRPPVPPAPGGPTRGRVAAYAQGRDYHRVFEPRLRRLARAIRDELGAGARATVDYGRLLERPFAATAGMGWQGKSTMLLVPGLGPWVLLGAVVTTLDLPPGAPLRKSCGACTRCIAACPTGALAADGSGLDSRLCISYHTIENRGVIPRELRAKFGGWVFGCDDCLDSCPVGQHGSASYPGLEARDHDDAWPALVDLLALDEPAFRERFRGRAITRAKRDGLVRNACIALGNTGTEAELPALLGALADRAPLVRRHAAWAVARLVTRRSLDPGGAAVALRARLEVEDDPSVRDELAAALAELGAASA
jgi:epoxyqueuosine reductase